jgi:hypothetical protein
MFRGLLRYFPAALAGVARHSKAGNDKHNPGEEMHHARGKSSDHADCIVRHLVDLADLEAYLARADKRVTPSKFYAERVAAVLAEADALVWRACALSQELYETHVGAPLAPGARLADQPKRPAADALPVCASCGRSTPQAVESCDRWDCYAFRKPGDVARVPFRCSHPGCTGHSQPNVMCL